MSIDTENAGAEPAGLLRRLAAGAYDLLPLIALWMGGTAILLPFTAGRGIPPHNPAYQVWLIAIAYFYYTLSWQFGGQTIGMRAWRIRMVPVGAANLGWGLAGLRFGVAVLGVATLGAGVVAALFDGRRRMWHDRAARTEVLLLPKRKP